MLGLHTFEEFDVLVVQTAELWQTNSVTVDCLYLGSKSNNFLDSMS